MKKIFTLILLLLGGLVLGGCSHNGNSTNVSAPAQPSTQETVASPNTINIQNFSFSPATLTVKKGATVTWINNDSVPHQINSTTFNSSQLSKGQSFSFTFDTVGTFDYLCSIHPSMLGKIIVE